MQKSASSQWLKKISRMMPIKIPGGPPLPYREIINLLKRVRTALDHAIVSLEKESKPATTRKRKSARAA